MSERELYAAFPLVFGGAVLLGVVLFALSLFLLQRRRTGGSYRHRRAAGERGGRLFILSVTFVALGIVMGFGWLTVGLIYRDQLFPPVDRGDDDLFGVNLAPETLQALTAIALTPTITPTFTPTDTPTPPPTLTPLPTLTPIPTDAPTVTPLPTSTETPLLLVTNTPSNGARPLIPTRVLTTPPRN